MGQSRFGLTLELRQFVRLAALDKPDSRELAVTAGVVMSGVAPVMVGYWCPSCH